MNCILYFALCGKTKDLSLYVLGAVQKAGFDIDMASIKAGLEAKVQ